MHGSFSGKKHMHGMSFQRLIGLAAAATHGWRHGLSMVALALLCSCATPPRLADPTATDTSLIYMYVDLSEAPSDVRWFSLLLRPKADPEDVWESNLAIEDGVMSHISARPGAYNIEHFGGIKQGFLGAGTQWIYEYHGERNGIAPFIVDQPGVYFLGSYKLKFNKGGLLSTPEFDLVRIAEPSEREVLQRLLQRLEKDEFSQAFTRQLTQARERLHNLSAQSVQR